MALALVAVPLLAVPTVVAAEGADPTPPASTEQADAGSPPPTTATPAPPATDAAPTNDEATPTTAADDLASEAAPTTTITAMPTTVAPAPAEEPAPSSTVTIPAPTASTSVPAEPTAAVAATPPTVSDVEPTTSDAAPSANRDGGMSAMALLPVDPPSYDWGSLPVGEVGPWVPFAYDRGDYEGQIAFAADTGLEIDGSGNFDCGEVRCLNVRFAPAPHQRGPISANIYFGKVDTDEWTAVPTTGRGLAHEVAISPTSLNFGEVLIGSTSSPQTATFSNVGDFAVNVTGIRVSGQYGIVGDTCMSAGMMPPGATCTLDVIFRPSSGGSDPRALVVTTAQGKEATAPLTGTGVSAPELAVTPTSANFDSTPIGSTSRPVIFTVSNHGMVPVAITSVFASPEWSIANSCPSVVAAGTQCTLEVRFTPSARDLRTGTLTVISEAPTVQVPLSGHGLGGQFRITPASPDFGVVDVGATSSTVTLTVTNTGWIPTDAQPSTAAPFTIESTTCGVLDPDETCTAVVTFSPTAGGTASGTFTVTGPPTPQDTIPLVGFGAIRTAELTPTNVDFGAVALGGEVDADVVLRNTGNVDLTVNEISLPDEVSVASNGCDAALAPDATCTYGLRFAPELPGAFSGSLKLQTTSGALTASLTGTGLPLAVTPAELDLGDVTVAHEATANVTITNLAADAVPLGRSNPAAPFTLTDGCPESLPGGDSCVVTVRFAPTEATPATSSFTVASPADGSLQEIIVDLTGRGLPADLSIAPLDLGPVFVGESATTTATITNAGGAAVTIDDVTVPAPFGVVSAAPCVGDLAPQASCVVDVTFDPTTPGAAASSLVVHHLAGETTTPVQGFGVTTGLEAAPSPADFDRVLAGTSSGAVVVTVTNGGNVDVTFDAATVDAPFEIVDDGCDAATLVAEQTCEIAVRYSPAADAAGDQTGTLGVMGASGGRPLGTAVELTGFATVATIDVTPTTHDFGVVAVGRTAPPAATTITNTGNVALLVGVGDVDDDALTLDSSACAGVTLEPGASCDLSAGYTPTAPGTYHATAAIDARVELASGTHDLEPIEITLDGEAAAADLSVDPDAIDFGEAVVGTATGAHSATVTNHGPDVTITGVAAPEGFVVDDGCIDVTLATDESCEIAVHFEPTTPGASDGVLAITGDAAGTDLAVALTGFAPEGTLAIAPAGVAFGEVPVGERSPAQTVTLVNDSNATVTVTEVDLQGASPAGAAAPRRGHHHVQQAVVAAGDFELSPSGCAGRVLAPGEECAVSVVFAPRTAGTASSTLRFETDRGGQSIALTGTGIAPGTTPTRPGAPTPAPGGTLPATGAPSPLAPTVAATALILFGLALTTLRRRLGDR